ncbi:MAG: hypothetical protein LBJ02_05285 [Bifidobacteriaceae bacterium]|jgi:hypothetical protein|nr:hypothetical protein [Bifidobacteriaceae bacterium]
MRRAVRRLVEGGSIPARVSSWIGLPESEVAAEVPMPLEGFSGATPKEICERYAAGEIDREQLIDELVRYPYVPRGKSDGYDSLLIDPPGSFAEVQEAGFRGLISSELYGAILAAREAALR